MRLPDEPGDATDGAEVRVHRGRLRGLHRGADVSGEVEVTVEERGLRLAIADGPTLPVLWAALDGVDHAHDTLTLYLMGDDVLELEAVRDAPALAGLVTERACRLGELTLALRGLGSVRANPGTEHQRFYGPLIAARRALEGARTPEAQWTAVNAEQLRDAMRATLGAFAAERFPGAPADRRALEAELLDHAAGMLVALERLAEAREAARRAPPDTRFAWWRQWASALRVVFAEHDRAWMAALPALCDSRGRQGRFWRRLLGFGRDATALLALAALPLATEARAQGGAAARDDGARETLRVPGVRAESLTARGFDVVTVQGGVPYVVAGAAERARLSREGFAAEPLATGVEARLRRAARDGRLQASPTIVYRPFDDPVRGVRAWLDSMSAAHPALMRLDTLGYSHESRPILAARIGPGTDDSPARPNVVYMATYHAREWIATETALRLVRHLVTSTDARTRALVAARDVWVVPVVNPDGYQYTFDVDRLWRKNRRAPTGGFTGVDLNRNHEERWGWDDRGSSPIPQAETYRGPSAASEPETQAVQALHRRVRPVLGVSYHSFSALVLHPPGYAPGLLPQDLGVYRALAGTDLFPAVRDRVPGSTRSYYHPGPGWHLYVTNGDYNDWAAARGTLAFTPELTSGCDTDCVDGFYGFLFPDNEEMIAQVFADNLPFALDVLEAAADPRGFRSTNTGLAVPRVELESASPQARVRLPVENVASATLRTLVGAGGGATLPTRQDTVPSQVVEARLMSAPVGARPAGLELSAGALRATWRTLLAGGGEAGDTGWENTGWLTPVTTAALAGRRFWESTADAELRSPAITVPDDADTVTVAWWHQHTGNPFALDVAGEVRVSLDGGAWVPVMRIAGNATVWYPDQARVGGVRGRSLRVAFVAGRERWRLDEVMVLAHDAALPSASGDATLTVRPSANPVRGASVTFAWPADAGAGEIVVYDFAGRLVWRRAVAAGESSATWGTAAASVANGAYVVLARAGTRTGRLTLYVAR